METINEALNKAFIKSGENAYFGSGFYSGVEFSQRWIPVEEELPELTDGATNNAVNVKFITIHGDTMKCTAVLEPITRHSGSDSPVDLRWYVYPSIGHELKTVTHWRPMERNN
ncbi:MAG: hypothetical protein ACYC5G_04720 [Candidatus Doudnabacteria bacterium]